MYRRDLITAEIQKLAQVLSRIMGLKLEGNHEEAEELLEQSLMRDFELSAEEIYADNSTEFETLLNGKAFPAEKLEMLSQFLYSSFDSSEKTADNNALAEKLLLIYQILEVKHHIVSMVNLDRQKAVSQYLNP